MILIVEPDLERFVLQLADRSVEQFRDVISARQLRLMRLRLSLTIGDRYALPGEVNADCPRGQQVEVSRRLGNGDPPSSE